MARTAEEFIINKFKIDIMPNELTFFHEQLFELMESYHKEKLQEELPNEMNQRVAKLIIQIRNLFIEAKDTPLDTMDEIWHLLYQIANPNYDKLSDEVWSEIEKITNR